MTNNLYLRLVISVLVLTLTCAQTTIRKDGETEKYVVGAILPIHENNAGQCGKLNIEGAVVADAIIFAVNRINYGNEHDLTPKLKSVPKLGYHIRDSCQSYRNREQDIAYEFIGSNRSQRKTKNATQVTAVTAVIGPFDMKSLGAAKMLSFEDIPQLSYAVDNIKFDGEAGDVGKYLFSVYPEDILKMKAVLEIIENLDWQYITLVGSDNKRGRKGLDALEDHLNSKSICHSEKFYVSSVNDARNIVRDLVKKTTATIVVLDCSHEESLWILQQAKMYNMTNRIWISTASWEGKLDSLKEYVKEVEGTLTIMNSDSKAPQYSNQYVGDWKKLFQEDPGNLIKDMFQLLNGPKRCLDPNNKNTTNCEMAEKNVQKQFRKYQREAVYAIDSVYAYAFGLAEMKSKQGNITQLPSFIQNVNFDSPITKNQISFTTDRVVQGRTFALYSIEGNTTAKIHRVRVGFWKKKTGWEENNLFSLTKSSLKWKDGSTTKPISKCSATCQKGTSRTYATGDTCCWQCDECVEGRVTNTSNAPVCFDCPKGETANPSQSKCVKYTVIYFRWFSAMGEFLIFFITAGVCVGLFTLGIFSQNRESRVVEVSNYKTMCFMLLGVFLCFLTPIPLLVQPTVGTCITFVTMFNMALTIPMAVLAAKTGYVVNRFFDDDGEVKDGLLGSRPQLIIIAIVCLVQVIILIVGFNVTTTEVIAYDTAKWWEKLIECNSLRGKVFWVAFGYNILLSLVVNFMSCGTSGEKVEENYKEIRWICLTTCCFYLGAFIYIIVLYATFGIHVVESASIMIIIFGFLFFFCYFWPKLYNILFNKNEEPPRSSVRHSLLFGDSQEGFHLGPHVSGVDAFKHHKVLQIKVKDGEGSREESKE